MFYRLNFKDLEKAGVFEVVATGEDCYGVESDKELKAPFVKIENLNEIKLGAETLRGVRDNYIRNAKNIIGGKIRYITKEVGGDMLEIYIDRDDQNNIRFFAGEKTRANGGFFVTIIKDGEKIKHEISKDDAKKLIAEFDKNKDNLLRALGELEREIQTLNNEELIRKAYDAFLNNLEEENNA